MSQRATTSVFSSAIAAAAMAIAVSFAASPSCAQEAPPPATAEAVAAVAPAASAAQLAPVTVTARNPLPPASVSGWGDRPLAELPLAATVIGSESVRSSGAARLADLIGLDASLGDAYNSEGYWDFLTVRGFTLDNRFNFRRDGLPINAETFIALDNKSRIEVLKGTSGMQAGTSAPGGLVNYVVKRPAPIALRSASVEWRERGSVTAAVDLSQRFGADGAFGARVNAALGEIRPQTFAADGRRRLFSLAADARLARDSLLEAEVETSRRTQPSVPGFSLLGNTVPAPGDPRINLNDQPWSQPVVLDGTTASLRFTKSLGDGWRFVAHAATQRLRSDDRVAFPFGCTATDGTYYPDRYCPDGTFDLYDFRSEDERRRSDSLDVSVSGSIEAAGITHRVRAGVLRNLVRNRFGRQAFNFAGTGNVDGTLIVPAAPDLTAENTDRDERSTELYAQDSASLGPWTGWIGLRHTRLHRAAVNTDGTLPSPPYDQSFTSPFVALSVEVAPGIQGYASWGRGVESEVVPNRSRYLNQGASFTLQSRQAELGLKGQLDDIEWSAALFDIRRPSAVDLGACDVDASCTRAIDGAQRHRGVEASVAWRAASDWTLRGGAQWLRARREDSADAAADGLVPVNVAQRAVKASVEHRPMAGLGLVAGVVHEGPRFALPDNSARLPGWTRLDLGASFERKLGGAALTWRAGVDNATDKRAWKESPYQFGHAYLFPLAPRTWRASLQVDW